MRNGDDDPDEPDDDDIDDVTPYDKNIWFGANNALALLSFVVKQDRHEIQSTTTLARNAGMSQRTVINLLNECRTGCRKGGGAPRLDIAARAYGFNFKIYKDWNLKQGRGRIIDVELRGYGNGVHDFE
jgi:hypothetical protein